MYLDLVGGTHDRFARVTTGLAQCPRCRSRSTPSSSISMRAVAAALDSLMPMRRSARNAFSPATQVTDARQGLVCRFASSPMAQCARFDAVSRHRLGRLHIACSIARRADDLEGVA